MRVKQTSPCILWNYSQFKPWQHYIPVEYDFSDFFEKLQWVKKNDQEAKKIAFNAKKLAIELLTPRNILLYHYKILKKYSSLQK